MATGVPGSTEVYIQNLLTEDHTSKKYEQLQEKIDNLTGKLKSDPKNLSFQNQIREMKEEQDTLQGESLSIAQGNLLKIEKEKFRILSELEGALDLDQEELYSFYREAAKTYRVHYKNLSEEDEKEIDLTIKEAFRTAIFQGSILLPGAEVSSTEVVTGLKAFTFNFYLEDEKVVAHTFIEGSGSSLGDVEAKPHHLLDSVQKYRALRELRV